MGLLIPVMDVPVATSPSQRAVFSVSVSAFLAAPHLCRFHACQGQACPAQICRLAEWSSAFPWLSGLRSALGEMVQQPLQGQSLPLSRPQAAGPRRKPQPLQSPPLCSPDGLLFRPVSGPHPGLLSEPARWCRSWGLPRQSWLLFSLRGEPSSVTGWQGSGRGQAVPLELLDSHVARGSLFLWLRAWHRIHTRELLAQGRSPSLLSFPGKQFKCTVCDYTAAQKPQLLRHMEQHASFKVRGRGAWRARARWKGIACPSEAVLILGCSPHFRAP